jgi:hypothetical protein
MPLLVEIEDGIEVEISDDGAISFPSYDIETDLMKVDLLGEEKSPAVILLEQWQNDPIPTLFNICRDSGYLTKNVFIKTGALWINAAIVILWVDNCISDDFKSIFKMAISADKLPSIMGINFCKIESSSIKEALIAYSWMRELPPDAHPDWYIEKLIKINTQINHAMYWCGVNPEPLASFHKKRLLDAIRTIEEHD